MEKRGQDISLTTILLMVLGVVVIVLLIWGFSSGWSSMWEKITGFGGGKSNVDSVKQSCDLACQGSQTDAFCTQKRTVNFEDKRTFTTPELVNKSTVSDNCKNLSIYAPSLGIKDCPAITCTA